MFQLECAFVAAMWQETNKHVVVVKESYWCFLSCRGAKVPEPPEGHKWQKVIHDNKVHVSTNIHVVWR